MVCVHTYSVCVCIYQFTHPCCWVEKRKPGERTGREWSGETGKISIKQRITGRKHILGKTFLGSIDTDSEEHLPLSF